ncbi:DUF4230 domain-containing protein [Kineosporia sp. NBRC 101731]|uniref:DUF4230 domain-containing protein n=1 Tax=Kineosporia sp. NBRC 101731 TaxID=3032199 RepID=UPI00249F98F3|nr:DUF4230 domain-containing protein [Kineosporia sp. NBRC 101731]GLY33914.1 hypothetical protein Kisp02_72790 [Kineosporia sp. NBRC 101731]
MGQKTTTRSEVSGESATGSGEQERSLTASPAGGLEKAENGAQRRSLVGRRKEQTEPLPTSGNGGDKRTGGDTIVYKTEPPRKRSGFLTAALVVAVLIVSGALALNLTTGAIDRLNPFKGLVKNQTIDRSGPAVLQSIQDLGQFEAASGYYELVVDVEKDVKPVPSFLAGQRTLFIAAGSVDAGVNLSKLGEGAIVMNDDRTEATINLPTPTMSSPTIDYDRSYVYSRDRGVFDRVKGAFTDDSKETSVLYGLASQRLSQAAAETDELRERAEKNTRATLEGLLEPLGFTKVTVNFAR